MRVSVLYLTINRYPSCINNLKNNLNKCGLPPEEYEILWCDNGSTQPEVITGMSAMNRLAYAHVNKENCGISRMLNQLILRSHTEYVMQLGNDYDMPDKWLKALVDKAASTPGTGMIGIAWSHDHVHPSGVQPIENPLFGCKLKTRAMLDEVGAFDEKLHCYGLEDSDYHIRSVLAGFKNYYLPGYISKHLGGDTNVVPEYRQMKDMCLRMNGPYHVSRNYKRYGYYIPWPAKERPFNNKVKPEQLHIYEGK
jgi:GT2 family glycosyltransferase